MKQVTDQDFDQWLTAVERDKELPATIAPDDAADLRLARSLFSLRSPVPRTVLPVVARSQVYAATQERRRIWRLAGAAVLVVLMLAVAIGSSGDARAQILTSLGLAEEEAWVTPIPVIFEGQRYEPAAFQLLYEEELQEVDLVFVLGSDERRYPILFAFRSPEEARLFLNKRQGAPQGKDHADANN